jgi:hypothetical protein
VEASGKCLGNQEIIHFEVWSMRNRFSLLSICEEKSILKIKMDSVEVAGDYISYGSIRYVLALIVIIVGVGLPLYLMGRRSRMQMRSKKLAN